MSDGTLVGIVAIFQRHDPEAGLVNRTTFGFVPMNLALIRSFDEGKSWTEFEPLTPPLVGPSWDICHPILELRSGRWLLPTATWRGWNGENPSGEQTVAFISDDRGRTWPKFGRIFDGRKIERSRLEVSLVELLDERVLAVAWVHDAQHCKNYPTEYAISDDNAETFSDPQQTGFEAETCKMLVLRDGRIFCAYRRTDKPGLWGCVATMRGSGWINSGEAPLWQGAGTVTTSEKNSADGLSALKFGYPSLGQLQDGKVLVVFWCQEACITNIRWLKIAVW